MYVYHTGSVYLNDCPRRHIIPVWLIVFGCVGLLQTFINIAKRFFRKKKKREEEDESYQSNYAKRTGSCFETFLIVFLFVWIILGSYWVFGYYYVWRGEECTSSVPNSCCHRVPYLFSYVMLVVIYATSCIFCCCCCCLFCIIALTATGG